MPRFGVHMISVLTVCLGNICRSPMAQVVLRHHAHLEVGLPAMHVESAGTHVGMTGQRSDPRARAALTRRGYDPGQDRARRVVESDFDRFNLILAMDKQNLQNLQALCPTPHQYKLRLFLDYATEIDEEEVPDPYYGSAQGFERVLDLCEAGAKGLISKLQQSGRLG
jgi:protein-tyrosine phosphatase